MDPTGNKKKTFVPVRNVADIYTSCICLRNRFVNIAESRNATLVSANPFKRIFEAANMSSETQVDKIMRLSANKSDKQ